MPNIATFKLHLLAPVLLLAHLATAQADTLKCGKVSIKDGKGSLLVSTFSATRCPKGYELILNASQLSREVLSALPPLAGTAAGGALSGTYPNPDIAAGTVGPTTLSTFPGIRQSLTKAAAVVPGVYTGTPHNFAYAQVPYDTISYDTSKTQPADALFLHVPLAGVYLIDAKFSWGESAVGSRELLLLQNNQIVGHQLIAPAPTDYTIQTATAVQRLAQGDNVMMLVGQNSGSPITSVADKSGEHASLAIQWIGP